MKEYHLAWLAAHPERSRKWLRTMMAEGFEVHHIDLDHDNNHPANLALIEGVDHMRLHGLFKLARPDRREAIKKAAIGRWGDKSPEQRSAHGRMMAMTKIKNDRKRRREAQNK